MHHKKCNARCAVLLAPNQVPQGTTISIYKEPSRLHKINFYGEKIHREITADKEEIKFKYSCNVDLTNYKNNYLKKLQDNIKAMIKQPHN